MNRLMNRRGSKGFTIIELLVSMVIIIILTGIITENLLQARAKARDTKRVNDLSTLHAAIGLYFEKCNKYPFVNGQSPSFVACISDSTVKLSNFITTIPNPPTSKIDDKYEYLDNGGNLTDYVLRAKLETNSSVLNDDLDGIVFTKDCSDTPAYYYCIGPK